MQRGATQVDGHPLVEDQLPDPSVDHLESLELSPSADQHLLYLHERYMHALSRVGRVPV